MKENKNIIESTVQSKFINEINFSQLYQMISKGENLDLILSNHINSFLWQKDEFHYLPLQSIGAIKKQNISNTKLNILIEILHRLTMNPVDGWKNKFNMTLLFGESLPFSKFFIDLDCSNCKNKTCGKNTRDTLIKILNKISKKINDIFKSPISFFFTTKPTNPFCGCHLMFFVNVDIMLKQVLYHEILKLDLENYIYSIDITTNVPLPLSRNHTTLNEFNNDQIKQLEWDVENLKKMCYYDIWGYCPKIWNFFPLKMQTLTNFDVETFILKINLLYSDKCKKTLFYSINSKIENSILCNVPNASHKEKSAITSYTNKYFSSTQYNEITYCNTIHGRVKKISKILINYMLTPEKKIGHQLETITNIDKPIEFYQQSPEIVKRANKKRKIDNDMKTNVKKIKLTNFIDNRKYLPFSNQQLAILNNILQNKNEVADEKTPDIWNKIYFAFENFIDPYAKLLYFFKFKSTLAFINFNKFVLTEKDLEEKQMILASKKREKNIQLTTEEKTFLNCVGNFDLARILIKQALVLNYTTATVSFLLRKTNLTLETILHFLLREFCNDEISCESIYIMTRMLLLDQKSLSTSLKEFYIIEPFMFVALHEYLQPNSHIVKLQSAFDTAMKSLKLKLNQQHFLKLLFCNIFNIQKFSGSYLVFNGLCYEKVTKITFTNEICPSFNTKFSAILKSYEIPKYEAPSLCLHYQHFTDYGEFNPLWPIYESASPSLRSLIMRVNDKHYELDKSRMSTTPAQYKFLEEIHFKLKPFLNDLHSNCLSYGLLAPVFCPNYHSKNYMKHFIDFSVHSCNVSIEDINNLFRVDWKSEFVITLCQKQKNFLGVAFQNYLGIIAYFVQNFNLSLENPSRFLMCILGNQNYELCGTKPYTFSNQKLHFINNSFNEISDENINFENATNKENDFILMEDSLQMLSMDVEDSKFFQILRQLTTEKKNQMISDVLSKELRDKKTNGNDCLIKLPTKLNKYTNDKNNVVQLNAITQKNLLEVFENVLLVDGFIFDVASTTENFLKFSILTFSWFLRIGDHNTIGQTNFFQYLGGPNRKEIYSDFSKLVLSNYRIDIVENIYDFATILKNFDDTHKVNLNSLDEPRIFSIEKPNYDVYRNSPVINNIRNYNELMENETYSHYEKENVYVLFATLLLTSGLCYDLTTELLRLGTSVIFPGNFSKVVYNLYGNSNAGKTRFVQMLGKAFECKDVDKNVSSQRYTSVTTSAHDVNASVFGRSLVANIDDPKSTFNSEMIKQTINTGNLSTRPMHENDQETYLIQSKLIITSNAEVTCQNDDEGWNSRIRLLFFRHSFEPLVSRVSRLIDISLHESSSLLAAQMMTNKYVSCTIPDITQTLCNVIIGFYSKFYFKNYNEPISKSITKTSTTTLKQYLNLTSPFNNFQNTVKIVRSEKKMYNKDVRSFIEQWLSNRKQFAHIDKDSFTRRILNYISDFADGQEGFDVTFQTKF